ncbi:uncharacterized protein LOC111619356 [Centruroides sculpturatus]|uniref:uncharacterized protein LOC111619356 n=1 Tax=Centruroides sculpturatus TaxID=218467 RepID=UPI000C6E0B36|nr:uncharacterized protein LOC111619356 [Centruroides sculpturatus]
MSSLPSHYHPSFAPNVNYDSNYSDKQVISIFTDGSKSDQGVGSAFVVNNGQHCLQQWSRKLASHCTNNQAESLAIQHAINWIVNAHHNWPNYSFHIFSDSRVALQQIAKINSKLPIIKNCISNLQDLTNLNIRVYLHWTKGHAGNERADLLTRGAPLKTSSHSYDKVSKKLLSSLIHKIMLNTWKIRWDNGDTSRLTHSFFPCPTDNVFNPLLPSFQLTQLLTGHGNLNTYLKRFLDKTDGMCNCSMNEEEEPNHIIFHCPQYARQRKKLSDTVIDNGFHWPCMLKDFTSEKKIFVALKNFATEIKKLD